MRHSLAEAEGHPTDIRPKAIQAKLQTLKGHLSASSLVPFTNSDEPRPEAGPVQLYLEEGLGGPSSIGAYPLLGDWRSLYRRGFNRRRSLPLAFAHRSTATKAGNGERGNHCD